MRGYFLVYGAFILLSFSMLSACTHLSSNEEFLGLFRNAKEVGFQNEHSVYVISDAVHSYVEKCCDAQREVLLLLEKNGFKSYSLDGENKDMQEIYATKRVSSFPYMWKTYDAYFSFKDSHLVKSEAYVKGGAL